MITYPIAKINLGLNVVERRPDGYHNLETVFFPVPLTDVLKVRRCGNTGSLGVWEFGSSGIQEYGNASVQDNLVAKAYRLLKEEFGGRLPAVDVQLFKAIPSQAGMGGGSSDAASMLMLLNREFGLGLNTQELIERAKMLGADCPFFILGCPAYAEGIGERLKPVKLSLSGWHLCVVRPNIGVPTRDAFALIKPQRPAKNCLDVVHQPIETWRDDLKNDFEQSVFTLHPAIGELKERLYTMGATYAAMSGSGSALFGLFDHEVKTEKHFPDMFTFTTKL